MTCRNSAEVKITTFINPHLFWIFEKDNGTKRDELESKLLEISHTVLRSWQLEQYVLVRNSTSYNRGIIKDYSPPDTYYCWLIDYGILYSTNKVYKMPTGFSTIPAMSKQAALDNVVCVKQVLGPVDITLVESLYFTPGTIHCAKNHIRLAASIFFQCVRESNNIHIGAINIRGRNGDQYDLSSLLIKEKLLMYNAIMFPQALEVNSNADNENYLKYARTLSPQCPSEVGSNCKDNSVYSITSKSVGRARTRNSLLEINSETIKNKDLDLQKWVNDTRNATAPLDDTFESETDSKNENNVDDSIFGSSLKIDDDLENIQRSDDKLATGSVSNRLSSQQREKLCAIRERHFKKTTSSSVSSSQLFLDKSSDQITDTDSELDLDGAIKPVESSSPKIQTTTEELNTINDEISSISKVSSWGGFEDKPSEKTRSSGRLLNIQPAGASYTSRPQPKARSVKKSSVSDSSEKNRCSDFGKFKDSASVISKQDSIHTFDGAETDIKKVLNNIDPNIVCVCEQCKRWASDTAVKCNKPIHPSPRKLVKPSLLLKSDDTKDDVVVYNFARKENESLRVSTDSKIIAQGTLCPKPISTVAEVPFNAAIHQYMRNFDQVYSIQSFVWPCLLRKMNVCIVNSPKTGKTMSYLPAMCSNLLEQNERYDDLPKNTISPIVIILCPGTLVADEVYDLVGKLLGNTAHRPVVALAVPPMDRACLNQFRKQCDLLITTPTMLVNLLHARIVTAKRVCHLILEQADLILDKFSKHIQSILNGTNNMLKNRNCNYSVQLIAVSETWTIPLENLMKRLTFTPFICIGAHLEAALYGRADLQMHFLESEAKKLTLCDLLKDTYKTCRTLVICNKDEQVDELRDILQIKGIKSAFVNNSMEKVEIEEFEINWLGTIGGKHFVFVCTDEIYNTILHVTNAVVLVHYGLPSTWTQFSSRFSCFIHNYQSPLASKKQEDWIRCKAHVFLDETCSNQFPKLIQLLKRMGCQLSTKFHEYYEASLKAKEEHYITSKTPLCSKLKLFGKCTNSKCKARHTLSEGLDYANDLPKNGTIKFKILKIRNVTSFSVKLLEHSDLNDNNHSCAKYPNLHKDLQNTMKNEKHGVYDARINDKYVYQSITDSVYHRCVIRKILKYERITKTASTVIIKLIDAGFDTKVSVADLYEMPEEFVSIPPQAIEIYLANLVPPDSDDQFSTYSKNRVTSSINEATQDGKSYCTGTILLQLGNALWIKNMYVMEHLPALSTTATCLNLSKDLLVNNIVDKSDSHLQVLYELCTDAGIELPNYEKPKIVKDVAVRLNPRWAFLDEAEYFEVYIITVQTPALFFVRIKKYHDLLMQLEQDILEAISNPLYPSAGEVCAGEYYLAKDPGGDEYCRVQVMSIAGGTASCFYVDYGDFGTVDSSEIKFLSNEFIERLPFQAIECRLYGVQPLFDTWESESIDIMDRYIFEPETTFFRTLYATSCKTEPPSATANHKYAILLIDMFTKKHTVINKLLIDCGEAVNVEGESIDVEFARPEGSITDPEEILEEVEDKELTFEEIQRLQKKYDKHTDDVVNGDFQEGWDIEINNPELFFKNLLGISNTTVITNNIDYLPPMRALPSPGYSTPNLEWSQTETHIKLNILLPNLDDYTLHLLRSTSLSFRALHNETDYRFDIQLYEKVRQGGKTLGAFSLQITLLKVQAGIWPRLAFRKDRLHFLRYDYKDFDEPEAPKKPILSLGQILEEGDALPGDNIMQYGSDGDSSSDYSGNSNDI